MTNSRASRAKTANHTLAAQAVLIGFGIVFFVPFLWLMATSLKSLPEISRSTLTFIPEHVQWDNYVRVFDRIPYWRYTLNTLYVTVLSVVGQVISSALVSYSLTKIDWKGRKWIFPAVIATMLLPYQVTMIPVYVIFQKLHLVGTYWPLIIPAFTAAPFYVFLLRQFFMTLPDSLIQAARIDGANEFTIFSRIVLPLCRPALATVAIFTFLFTWSDFLGPLIYLNDSSMYTLTLGLQSFLAEHYVEWDLLMAASAMFTLPVIVMFFCAQRYFIEGINLTGVKG